MRFAAIACLVLLLSACGFGGDSVAKIDQTRDFDGGLPELAETPEAPAALASREDASTATDDVVPVTTTTEPTSAEPEARTPTAAELEAQQLAADMAALEEAAGPTMDSCGFTDVAIAPPGSLLESADGSCPNLTVPALPCQGNWGVLPGLTDVLVVLRPGTDVFGSALHTPEFDEPAAIVCVNPPKGDSFTHLVPCGDARRPGEEHVLTVGQRILRTTIEWHATAAAELAIGTDAAFFGNCTPPETTTGDPTVNLGEVMMSEDVEAAGDRIVDFAGSWVDLRPVVERLHAAGSLLDPTPAFANDTCLALDEFINVFDHAVANAMQTHGFRMPWLNDFGEFSGSDHAYPARLGTGEKQAKALLQESTDLGEALVEGLGESEADVWMRDAIESLNDVTHGGWVQLIVARFNAIEAAEVYDDLDAAMNEPAMARQLETLGLVLQVRNAAECTGKPDPRTDWLNPELVFAPRLDEYEPMGSSQLREFTVEPTTSTCEANIVVSDLSQSISLAAGRDVFGFDGAGRLNATAVSLTDGNAVALAAAQVEAARQCPSSDQLIHEVRDVGGYPVIVTQEYEGAAKIWSTHLARNNIVLRFAKWFSDEDSEAENAQRFLEDVEMFRSVLNNAVPEDEIFVSDLR